MPNIPRDAVLADVQRTKTGTRIRVYWIAGFFTALVFIVAIVAAWRVVVAVAPYLFGLAVLITLAFVAVVFYELAQGGHTRHKEHDARRRIIEAQARQQEAAARAAEFFTFSRSEGVIRHMPGGLDVLALPAPAQQQAMPLDAGDEITELDFFSIMTQPRRAYGIRAGQQVGKTWLMHHIAGYWQARRIQPLVLSQKYDSGDYAHCLKYGPEPDSIREGFDVLQREAAIRQEMADNGTPYNDMTLQPVILEDWTSMGAIIGQSELEQFIGQALTVYAGRSILIYFVTHASTKGSYGLGRLGAALKDQLTDLEILPYVANRTGVIDRTRNQYLATIGGVCESVPVTGIPTQAAQLTGNCEPALYSLAKLPAAPTATEVKPLVEGVSRQEESRILRLAGQDASVSTIAAVIFGEVSKHNNGKVKKVLEARGIIARDGRSRGPKYSTINVDDEVVA